MGRSIGGGDDIFQRIYNVGGMVGEADYILQIDGYCILGNRVGSRTRICTGSCTIGVLFL